MSLTLIIELLETLASTAAQVAPLLAQGEALIGDADAAALHIALQKAEAATAQLRSQVDAALTAAAARG